MSVEPRPPPGGRIIPWSSCTWSGRSQHRRNGSSDWLADPTNLAASPLVLKAGWAKSWSEPGVGAVREVTGVGVWFPEEITAYDAPRSYSYLIVRSFPPSNHEGGTLTFTPRQATARTSTG